MDRYRTNYNTQRGALWHDGTYCYHYVSDDIYWDMNILHYNGLYNHWLCQTTHMLYRLCTHTHTHTHTTAGRPRHPRRCESQPGAAAAAPAEGARAAGGGDEAEGVGPVGWAVAAVAAVAAAPSAAEGGPSEGGGPTARRDRTGGGESGGACTGEGRCSGEAHADAPAVPTATLRPPAPAVPTATWDGGGSQGRGESSCSGCGTDAAAVPTAA